MQNLPESVKTVTQRKTENKRKETLESMHGAQ